MSTTIQLDLAEDVVREAKANGLLETKSITELLATELRRRKAAAELDKVPEEMREQPGEPMTADEIQAFLDDKTVSADLDIVRTSDRLERAEERQLELEVRQLGRADRRESRIRAARGERAARDHPAERLVGLDMTDTAAQLARVVNRDERSTRPIEHFEAFGNRRRRPRHVGGDRVARDLQEKTAIGGGGHGDG